MMRIDSYMNDSMPEIGLGIIRTRRLNLVPVRADLQIAGDLLPLFTDEESNRYNLWKPLEHLEEVYEKLQLAEEDWRQGRKYKWLLFEKNLLKFIGDFTLVRFDMRWKEVEIGYKLLRDHWRQGYMTEVLDTMLQAIFEKWKLERVVAYVQRENQASTHLLKKFEFTLAGHFPQSLTGEKGYTDIDLQLLTKAHWIRSRVTFSSYTPDKQQVFKDLHLPWLEKYGYLTEDEIDQLENPERRIIAGGGEIYFLHYRGETAGTVALKKIADKHYELVKMTIATKFRGQKLGLLLLEYAIEKAIEFKADIVELYSHRELEQAIKLYHQAGFRYADIPEDDRYCGRCDRRMILQLNDR